VRQSPGWSTGLNNSDCKEGADGRHAVVRSGGKQVERGMEDDKSQSLAIHRTEYILTDESECER